MSPRCGNVDYHERDSDDFTLSLSQSSTGEDAAFEKAIAIHYAAAKEKKRQEKERKFMEQASVMLKKDLSNAMGEFESARASIEKLYADFIDDYAATEDRIQLLWSEISKEHQALELFIKAKYQAGGPIGKEAERLHILGLSKLRAACQETEEAIQKMVPEPEEKLAAREGGEMQS